MTTQTINLNMIPGGVMPVVYASQYDNQTDAVIFKLYNGTLPFNVPSGAAVLINGTKPDVTGFSYTAASVSGNTAVCNVTTQMTAVAGDVMCELRIRTESQIIGSVNFILRVEKTALGDDAVLSETDIPLIEQAVEIAADLSEYIETAVTSAETASEAAEEATEAAAEASVYNNNVETLYNSIEAAKTAANTAAAAANAAAETLEDLSATANTLAAGSNATASYDSNTGVITFGIPRGATGESGVTTPISGLFTLSVDAEGGLWVNTNVELTADNFDYDEETGALYYVIDDEEEEEEG